MKTPEKTGLYQHEHACDACGVQAFVHFERDAALLKMCSHHANKHTVALIQAGWTIAVDGRAMINVKPSVSANAV